jgi:hypothetical protein
MSIDVIMDTANLVIDYDELTNDYVDQGLSAKYHAAYIFNDTNKPVAISFNANNTGILIMPRSSSISIDEKFYFYYLAVKYYGDTQPTSGSLYINCRKKQRNQ